MSGPKGGGYTLSAEALRQLEERRCAVLRTELAPVLEQLDALRTRCEAARQTGVAHAPTIAVPVLVGNESSAELMRLIGGTRAAFVTGQGQLRAAVERDRLERLQVALRGDADAYSDDLASELAEAAEAARARSAERGAVAADLFASDAAERVTSLRAEAADLVASLPDTTEADAIEQVMALSAECDAIDEPAALATRVTLLAQRVAEATDEAARHAHARTQAAGVLAVLAGLTSGDAETLRSRAEQVLETGEGWTAHLRGQASAEAARIAEAVERLHVADALADSLADLGYDVGPGFTRVLAAEGKAYAYRGQWAEHALQVRVDGSTDRLALQVVRRVGANEPPDPSAAEAIRDAEIEGEFCGSLPAVLDAAADLGVDVVIDRRSEAGSAPILRVADALPTGVREERRAAQAPAHVMQADQ